MQLRTITLNSDTKVTVKRTLPVPGKILVQRGQRVEALDVVAEAEMPSRYRVINVARQLAQTSVDMSQVMLKEEGDTVKANEVIAAASGRISLVGRSVRVPVGGRIAVIGPGWVLLEAERSVVEMEAFINGVVSWVAPDQRTVVIEGHGAMVEAACGFGGEAYGLFKRVIDSPFEPLTEDAIDNSAQDAILLGGRLVGEAALRRAEEVRVRGIVVGAIQANLMNLDPPVKVRVIATEGFGEGSMSPYTFGILRALGGRQVSIRATTPGWHTAESGLPREALPVILATTTRSAPASAQAPAEKAGKQNAGVGSRVRIIRGGLLGRTGLIDSVPKTPQTTEAGLIASGAYVNVDDQVIFVPWANLERVQ